MSTPFKAWARQYLQLGWSPIPLNLRSKDPVPEGFTGAKAGDRYVTAEDLRTWLAPRAMVKVGNLIYPPGNIALRLPRDIVGIDVDAHSGKAGSATFKKALEEWGALPPTWKTSSRPGSPLSGIYLFRVPVGLAWPGNLGKAARAWGTGEGEGSAPGGKVGGPITGGVDLIRWDHRYIMVGPSVHDKAPFNEYFWTTPDGQMIRLPWKPEDIADLSADSSFELPSPDEIPDMPEGWVSGLTEGRQWASSGSVGPGGPPTVDAVREWAKARDDRPIGGAYVSGICPAMERVLNKHLAQIRTAGEEGGAHDAARDAVWAVLSDSAAGHYGVGKAINRIRAAFLESLKGTSTKADGKEVRTIRRAGGERQASQEFWRILRDGAGKIINEHTDEETGGTTYEEEDPCSQLATAGGGARGDSAGTGKRRGSGGMDEGVGRKGKGSSAFDYKQDSIGNAQRLRRHLGGDDLDALWCGPLGGWHLWEPEAGLWMLDAEAIRMFAETMDMVRSMEPEAEFIEDEKMKLGFLKFISKSASRGEMKQAIDNLKSLRGVNTPTTQFDSDGKLLNCLNTVIVLGPDGVDTRAARRDDFLTRTTGVRYQPDSRSPAWEKFLEKFLPKEENRLWAQKLAGYSLYGSNLNRILVLCKGKTSTGKTTFAEAIRGALGMYGGPLPGSVLRDHQDERPRPDLLAVMDRRLVLADEMSQAWELHADMIKRLTGAGVTSARNLHVGLYVEKVPLFTPWIATNNTPMIKGADDATRRRILGIPFLHKISRAEEDARYKEALNAPEAREAILAWAVEGWKLYLEDPTLSEIPPDAAALMMDVADEINELAEFIDECCERGDEAGFQVPFSIIHGAYKDWCENNRVAPKDVMSSRKFAISLSNMGCEIVQMRMEENGKSVKGRSGIRLKGGASQLH